MANLGTLRPGVRAAMEAMDADVQTLEWLCIRAELMRLARIETDALIALEYEHDWQVMRERAEKAEAELAALKARMKPCARVVGGEVRVFMDSGDEGKYVAVLVVDDEPTGEHADSMEEWARRKVEE